MLPKNYICQTKKNMNSILDFHDNNFQTSLSNEEQKKILIEIAKLIPHDENIIINNTSYSKQTLYLFHLINDYHQAYLKSTMKEQELRVNTHESLGKGNRDRKKRLEYNESIMENENSSQTQKLTAFYEYQLLKIMINTNTKLACLALTTTFINKNVDNYVHKRLFLFNKKMDIAIECKSEALKFFEFTYLVPSKIVNSCAISLYQYLKHCTNINDKKKEIKFIRNIISEYFPEDAPNEIRDDSFRQEIYCAGIYNQTPIFQWNTSRQSKIYYKDEDIEIYYNYMNKASNKLGILTNMIIKILSNKNTKKEIEKKIKSKEALKKSINELSITYVKQPTKLIEVLLQYKQKSLDNNRFRLIKALVTIFTTLATKFTRK